MELELEFVVVECEEVVRGTLTGASGGPVLRKNRARSLAEEVSSIRASRAVATGTLLAVIDVVILVTFVTLLRSSDWEVDDSGTCNIKLVTDFSIKKHHNLAAYPNRSDRVGSDCTKNRSAALNELLETSLFVVHLSQSIRILLAPNTTAII